MASSARSCAALLLLLALAGVAYGQGFVRDLHHFKLAPGVKAVTLVDAIKAACAAAPKGQVIGCQVGADAGLGATLYPATAAANPNPEAAATIDFPTEKDAADFWKKLGADPGFAALSKSIVANPRLQYKVAGAPTATPVLRHSFQYTSFKDPKADNGKASMAILAYICKNIPIKAVTCTYGVDIGALGGATTDSPFGGVLEMANIADMRAYWKWLLADKEFAAFNKQYGPKASRIQYTTVAPAAAALALPGKPMPKVAAKVPAKMAAEPKMPAGRRLA